MKNTKPCKDDERETNTVKLDIFSAKKKLQVSSKVAQENRKFMKDLLSLSTQLAIEIVSMIMVGTCLGYFLGKFLKFNPWALFVGILFGILAAGIHVFRVMKPYFYEAKTVHSKKLG